MDTRESTVEIIPERADEGSAACANFCEKKFRGIHNICVREYASLSLVMSTRLDTCMEALRFLARSSELQANRLLTAELRIRDFLTPVGANRAAQRAALEELDNAVSREAELRPREASFWQEISDFIARRLATLNFD